MDEQNLPADFSEYVNVDEGLGRIMGNAVVYKNLLKSFLKKNYMDKLKEQMDQEDYENGVFTAHTIKGMAGNLSLPAVYTTSMALEASLKENKPSGELFDQLNDSVKKTMEYIEIVLAQL